MLKPLTIWNNCKFTHYWFITHYLILMLVSPIIESSIKNITYKEFSFWIIILLVINIFFGYYLYVVNENGYNYVNFIMLYYIGRYIHVSKEKGWYRTISCYSLPISIISCILFSIIYIIISNHVWIKGIRFWGYNSPWVLLSSVLNFIFISNLRISNKWINTVAQGTFGIYLLQGVGVFIPIRNSYAIMSYNELGLLGLFLYSSFLFLILATISQLINKCTQIIYKKIK